MKKEKRREENKKRIITLGDKCVHNTKGCDREKIAARRHFLSQECCVRVES